MLQLEHELPFPTERMIQDGLCDDETAGLGAPFVGERPAGPAGAIELARL